VQRICRRRGRTRRGWSFSGRTGAGDTWKRSRRGAEGGCSRRGAEGGCSRRGADRGGREGGSGGSWERDIRNRGRGSAGPSLSWIGRVTGVDYILEGIGTARKGKMARAGGVAVSRSALRFRVPNAGKVISVLQRDPRRVERAV
jgi:hypothetical protein